MEAVSGIWFTTTLVCLKTDGQNEDSRKAPPLGFEDHERTFLAAVCLKATSSGLARRLYPVFKPLRALNTYRKRLGVGFAFTSKRQPVKSALKQ